MTRGQVSAEMALLLAKLAGFELILKRCEILAPQLDWILEEAGKIEALNLAGIEPVNFFQPSAWMVHDQENEQQWATASFCIKISLHLASCTVAALCLRLMLSGLCWTELNRWMAV